MFLVQTNVIPVFVVEFVSITRHDPLICMLSRIANFVYSNEYTTLAENRTMIDFND